MPHRADRSGVNSLPERTAKAFEDSVSRFNGSIAAGRDWRRDLAAVVAAATKVGRSLKSKLREAGQRLESLASDIGKIELPADLDEKTAERLRRDLERSQKRLADLAQKANGRPGRRGSRPKT